MKTLVTPNSYKTLKPLFDLFIGLVTLIVTIPVGIFYIIAFLVGSIGAILYVLFVIAFWCLILWIPLHFICKFW